MAAAVDDDHSWEPPLLSWKGLQWWSVGCRAPAICEIFVGLKTKKLGKLIPTNPHKKKGKSRKKKKDGEDGIRSAQVAGGNGAFSSPSSASLQLPLPLSCRASDEMVPKRHSSFEERCLSRRIIDQLRRNSDAAIGNLRRNSDVSASAAANLRRNSDAGNLQQRLSASSAAASSSCGGYERVWALEGGNGVDDTLPRVVKLGGGGRRADESGVWAGQRRSFCSSFSSYSSAASCAGKVVGSRGGGGSSGGGEREQRHQNVRELVVGNQFFTHLTAAPLATKCHVRPHMRPSEGLLLDAATLRCREEELKDRIIFFV